MEVRMRAEWAVRLADQQRLVDGDVSVHANPWRHRVFCSTTSFVPSSWPYPVPYSCEYQHSSPAWYIFIWSHKSNLFSVQGQSVNLQHQINLMDRPAHRRTNPAAHLAGVLLNIVVRHVYDIYWMFVGSFMWVLISVVNYFVILVTLWSLWVVSCAWCIWWFCELCDVYVIYVLFVWME
jgi:hypothetical protein